MVHRRFEIDHRHTSVAGKSIEYRIGSFRVPVFQLGKCPYADRRYVSLSHPDEFFEMLCLVAVHHYALTMFERP